MEKKTNKSHLHIRALCEGALMVALAQILSFIKLFSSGVNWSYVPAYLIGTAVALVTGVLSIGALQLIAKKGAFGKFRYYCWGAGLVTLILSLIK